jgi:hypothetical protein
MDQAATSIAALSARREWIIGTGRLADSPSHPPPLQPIQKRPDPVRRTRSKSIQVLFEEATMVKTFSSQTPVEYRTNNSLDAYRLDGSIAQLVANASRRRSTRCGAPLPALVFTTMAKGTSPIAFEIFNKVAVLGNPFVFLMAGVATDYTEIGLLWSSIGRRTAIWLPVVAVTQILLLGALLNIGGWLPALRRWNAARGIIARADRGETVRPARLKLFRHVNRHRYRNAQLRCYRPPLSSTSAIRAKVSTA